MSKPITNGGFSNDGSKVMTQTGTNSATLCTVTFETPYLNAKKFKYDLPITTDDQQHELTISTTLYSSNLSLAQFYMLDDMSAFITNEKNKRNNLIQQQSSSQQPPKPSKPLRTIRKIAIQSPDELLVDCSLLITALQSSKYGHKDLSFYILGDTSYSSCCVDHVSAQHVDADLIIHLGFACLTQVESIPVYYAFGTLSLVNLQQFQQLQHPQQGLHPSESQQSQQFQSNTTSSLYRIFTPLISLLFKLCSTSFSGYEIEYSPSYDDYDEYPESLMECNSDEKYHYLVLLDQRYISQQKLLNFALKTLGFVTKGTQIEAIMDDYQVMGEDKIQEVIGEYFCVGGDKTPEDIESSTLESLLFTFLTNTIIPYLKSNSLSHPLYHNMDRIIMVLATPPRSNECFNNTANNNNNNDNSPSNNPNTGSTSKQDKTNILSILSQSTKSFNGLLEFAGYTYPITYPTTAPLDQIKQDIKTLTTRQLWFRFFNQSQWKMVFISNHIPFYTPEVLQGLDDGKKNQGLEYKTIPDPASSTYLTHLAMNFTQHVIYDCFPYFSLPFDTNRGEKELKEDLNFSQSLIHLVNAINKDSQQLSQPQQQSLTNITPEQLDSLTTMELFSPSSEQSRVLSQRFYLIEKCKNVSTIGIVAGTLSNQATLLTIERLKKLCQLNDIKHYTIAIGKINEAKLLNFGDISMFVVITCPLSVLFRFHNRHGQLHATTIDQWSLQQRLAGTKAGNVNNNKEKSNVGSSGGSAPTTITSMIDIVTPYECEMALNPQEFPWNGAYTTHFNDVYANVGRMGVLKEKITKDDVDDSLNEFVTKYSNPSTTSLSDSNTTQISATDEITAGSNGSNGGLTTAMRGNRRNEEEEDCGDVRYSSIDGKYHQINKKSTNSSANTINSSAANDRTSTQLVEQQTFGLIDPTTKKQLIYVKNNVTGRITIKEREFTGLAQDFDLTEANMVIQPGLHGNSEGYISVADKKSGNVNAEKH